LSYSHHRYPSIALQNQEVEIPTDEVICPSIQCAFKGVVVVGIIFDHLSLAQGGMESITRTSS
jgi:hypothetical protein